MAITLHLLSDRQLVLVLFSSSSGILSCSFHGNIFLCLLTWPSFLSLYPHPKIIYIFVYKVNQLYLPGMKEWPSLDVLWGSEVQSLFGTRARPSRSVPCVSCMHPPVVAGPRLLPQHAGRQDCRLPGCEAQLKPKVEWDLSGYAYRRWQVEENLKMTPTSTGVSKEAWDYKNVSH